MITFLQPPRPQHAGTRPAAAASTPPTSLELLGKEGVLALVDGESFHSPAVQVKKVVDTTAAGDSYNGGYLSARLQGKSAKAACQYAATLAAFVVEHTGAIVAKDKFAEFQRQYPLTDF